MRDLPSYCEELFGVDPCSAGDYVDVALKFLWEDEERSIHDKVAGDYDYEELIGTLIAAKDRISELESDRDHYQAMVDDYQGRVHMRGRKENSGSTSPMINRAH